MITWELLPLSVLLFIAAVVISIMLGRDIYCVMDIQQKIQSDSHNSLGSSGKKIFDKSSKLELQSRFRDIGLAIASLVIIYLMAVTLQADLVPQSDIDLMYRRL